MRKTLWTLMLATGVAAASVLAVACGDDDNATNNPTTDGGPLADSSATDANNNNGDAGDGGTGCVFSAFVINLINTQTTATAQPSTDLGQACTDTQNQADFASLFPAH